MPRSRVAYLIRISRERRGTPLRIPVGYLEPLRRFKDQKIQDTVVFFGSARVERASAPNAR